MLAPILSVFWIEKLRFTLYTLRRANECDPEILHKVISPGKSVLSVLEQCLEHDKKFGFYLPFSLRVSGFLIFPKLEESDIERDIEFIRDKYTPPAFPQKFLDIKIQSAQDLILSDVKPELSGLFVDWKDTLLKIEERLSIISQAEVLKKRYFSLTGIHTLSGAINKSTEHCHMLWHKYAEPNFLNQANQ